jgi:hypothetical protein
MKEFEENVLTINIWKFYEIWSVLGRDAPTGPWKAAGLAAGRIINIKEVELTIRSHTIKYLPTFHKFNALLDEVVSCFRPI